MSLAELTCSCFQNGFPAVKWISLCRLFISKDNSIPGLGDAMVERALSNSVLALYHSYPGDPDLSYYLKHAIQVGMISVPVFVSTLLHAAELHTPATLDMLCKIALDAHYSSGLPVVSYSESLIAVLGTVRDGLALLQTAHSLSHFHQLTTSASELVTLLLSCVPDISQVSSAQATRHFSYANDILQTLNLSDSTRQVLQTYVVSLSLLIGNDDKVAREAQMMQSNQIPFIKGDIIGPNSDTDIITFSLILHHLVSRRASAFGSGSGSDPIAVLLATLRWTSWTPPVFYTQLVLAAFTCLSQCAPTGSGPGPSLIWRAFILGRLPRLLAMFGRTLMSDNTSDTEWRMALQVALQSVLRRSDLIAHCDHILSQSGGSNVGREDVHQSFFRDFLQQLLQNGLVDHIFAVSIDPTISNDNTARVQSEAQEAGNDLESYLDSKLAPETGTDDVLGGVIERVWRDPGCHATFAEAIRKRFVGLTGLLDVESLSHLCKVLYLYDLVLDIVALHVRISDLIFQALLFLEEYDCETVGDPQTAVSHLGDVVLFVQSTLSRFHLSVGTFRSGNRSLSSAYLMSTAAIYVVEELSGDDAVAFGVWYKALFDSNSEGIEDTILRSTQPKMLLRISATLFSHAILATAEHKMDRDVLNNGVSYFLGPLLNWTLVGVVNGLLKELQQKGFSAPIHLEILQTLLLSPSCPRPVLCLCSPYILQLLGRKGRISDVAKFDIVALRRAVRRALGLGFAEVTAQDPVPIGPHIAWQDQSQQAIRDMLTITRAGKIPLIDIDRLINVTPPSKFIQLMWSELHIAAGLGEMEPCRRIATFVLTIPRESNVPPLLPTFLHIVLPSLIANIDRQQSPEQTTVELLVSIISSALTASLHLEWGLRSVRGEQFDVLGQSNISMVRRFTTDMQARKSSPTSRAIIQRLSSSPSFVANFPYM